MNGTKTLKRAGAWLLLALIAAAGTGLFAGETGVSAAPTCGSLCYVNGATGNDANDGATPGTALKTIQAGLDAVTLNGEVRVSAGTYAENLVISTSLTLRGAGQGSTVVIPAVSDPNCGGLGGGSICPGGSNVVLVQTDDVHITALTIDGDNPALTSAYTVGGANLDARTGIISNYSTSGLPGAGVWNNLEVDHVTVKNIYLRGIYASSGGTFNFHDNTVTNVQAEYASIAMFNFGGSGTFANNTVSWANDAISSNWSSGVTFSGNTVTHSGSGVHTDNSSGADIISGNSVSKCLKDGYGIFVFVPYTATTVTNNSVRGCAVGFSAWGSAAAVTTLVQDNEFDGKGASKSPNTSTGVYVTTDMIGWGDSDVSVSLVNNAIHNYSVGVQVTQKNGSTASLSVDAAEVTKNDVGLDNDGATLFVAHSCIEKNGTGILSRDEPGNMATTTADHNSITKNSHFGANNTGANTLFAEANWWGSSSGPRLNGSNRINSAIAVDAAPFLTSDDNTCQFEEDAVGVGDD